MEPDQDANTRIQNGMRDARTHINRQKTREGIEPPRTVAEQVEELVTDPDENGVRRRDPVGAAEAQRTHRDNGVGGAWIDTSQRANAPDIGDEEVFYEKLPGRHEERADEDLD